MWEQIIAFLKDRIVIGTELYIRCDLREVLVVKFTIGREKTTVQKTRLGISVGLLCAAVYFTGLFSGYIVPIILTGYVLLFENNEWLRKNVVKAIALMAFFSLLTVVSTLVPNIISLISNIVAAFGGEFEINFLIRIIAAIVDAIDIIEKILFIGLGFDALNQGSISIPVVDKLINKYM